MNIVSIICKKRDGAELSDDEIRYFVSEYTAGRITDYQASALLMAICIRGMSERETVTLTLCIKNSGEQVDLSGVEGVKVDKHSTGGVGDKTTLVVGPIAAACGISVPKMSGRGLGHTGGTIDKLESIDGFKTTLEKEKFISLVNRIGISVIGQSGNLAPADKKLYALRDVTGTVESLPLIASSIMGKKLTGGADAIVLDVKVGSGAFLKTKEQAIELARTMVSLGKAAGKPTWAMLTDMESPLGYTIGNGLEVAEAINTLKGNGEPRFTTLCISLAAQMLVAAGKGTGEACKAMAEEALSSGKALAAFRAMVSAQGGDTDCIDDPTLLLKASVVHPVYATESGYISKQNALKYGNAALALGAGRLRKEDDVDHSAGIVLNKKTGDYVEKGEAIAFLHTNLPVTVSKAIPIAERFVREFTEISTSKPETIPVVLGLVDTEGKLYE